MYLSAVGGIFIYLGIIGRWYDETLETGVPIISLLTLPGLFFFFGLLALSYHILTLFMEFNFDQGKRTRAGTVLTMLCSIVLAATADTFIRNGLIYLADEQQIAVPVYNPTESCYILALNVVVLIIITLVRTLSTVRSRFIAVILVLVIATNYLISFDHRSIVHSLVTNITEHIKVLYTLVTGRSLTMEPEDLPEVQELFPGGQTILTNEPEHDPEF